MGLGTEEETLLIAGVGYLIAVAAWAISVHARAKAMLRAVGEQMDPSLWQSLGAPASLDSVRRDPEKRWYRFIRSGAYRRQCDDTVIELIDDFRRRTKIMLAVCAGGGLLLLVRFWPLLKPDFV